MPRPVEAARPHKVNGFWFLVRRVPAEFAAYDTRKLVRQSTGIRIVDDPCAVRAGEVVAKLHSELIRYWRAFALATIASDVEAMPILMEVLDDEDPIWQ